ncbi:zinc finger protein 600-like isoform X2 [Sitophilus oryzae]|uniref:Zinc finger protein 600-like isoform X2 n=1 Tax=Sitophilus oryzae TaxID=7048 RepID=A0A6J2XXQ8_SITOR|nr:zinc finger protein 600-like isoform X2 [Sitophilus oryzae]
MAKGLKESQKKVYRCSTCSYQTPSKSSLNRHNNIHLPPEERQLKKSQKKVYRCSTCSYQTWYKYYLNTHNNIHLPLEERRLFVCAHCDKKYMSKKNLRDHLHIDHTDSRAKGLKESQIKVYRCSTCSYQTPSKYILNRHNNIHLPPEERQLKKSQKEVYRCSTCSYQTPSKSHLNTHNNIHLPPEERRLFVCTHCDKKYMSKKTLRDHLHIDHTDSRAKGLKESQKKVYRCSTCSYQTPYRFYLNTHNNIHLPPEERQLKELQKKVYRCSTCSYQTRYKSSLNTHNNIHLPPEERQLKELQKKVYSCSICSYQTPSKFRFNTHNDIHLPREERQLFLCAHCDKKYMSKKALHDHLHNDHSRAKGLKESQKKVYRCSTCSFQTPYKSHLKAHNNIHLPPEEQKLKKSHRCSTCSYQTPYKSHLNRHNNIHLPPEQQKLKKSHRCSLCSYRTPYKYHLKKHKNIHLPPEERQLFAGAHCEKTYMSKIPLRDDLHNDHTCSRNAGCTSVTDEVIIDSLKIEIDDHTPLKDEFKHAESATNEEKSECFLKIEPDDVTPILNNDMLDVFKNGENLSVRVKVKLEDFL